MASAPPIYDPGKPAAPTPLPQRDAAAYGSELAAGVGDVGRAVDHAATAAQATSYAIGDAQRQTAMSGAYGELQGMPRPGGAGFADEVGKKFDALNADVALPRDPELANRARVQMAQDRARWITQAQSWEAEQNGAATIDNLDQAGGAYAADLHDSAPIGNPAAARAALDAANGKVDTMIGATAGLHPDAALKIGRVQRAANGSAVINGLIDRGDLPGAAELLSSGALAGTVPPEHIQVLRDRLRAATDRAASEQRAAANHAVAEQRAALDLREADMQQGRASFDQWQQLAADRAAAGQPEKAVAARAKAVETGAAEGYRGASPAERDATINALAAKPTLSADEGATLRGLIGQRQHVASLSALDRAAYASGQAVAPLDPANPATWRARQAAVQSAVGRFGGVPDFFQPEDIERLKPMVTRGTVDDKIAAIGEIAAAGRYAGNALDQVAGHDGNFRAAATLVGLPNGEQLARDALTGPDALKERPGLLTPAKPLDGSAAGPDPEAIWASGMGTATAGLDGGSVAAGALKTNVWNVYLSRARASGATTFDRDLFLDTVNVVVGGRKTAAGWIGGVGRENGRNFILPTDMSQEGFHLRTSRAPEWAWLGAAVNGPPALEAGANLPAIARAAVKVKVRDGAYALQTSPGKYLQAKNGGAFLFDPHKLPDSYFVAPPDLNQYKTYEGLH